jgi:hypothetical protein
MGIPGNEIADEETKTALEDDLYRKKSTTRSNLLDQNRRQENKKTR